MSNGVKEMVESTERNPESPGNPVGELIKQARRSKKLTQKELASFANVSPVTLSRIETGESDPTRSTLQKISPHIGVPYPELLVKAGYSNARGEGALYSRDGNMLDMLSIISSIYRADSDLLICFSDFEKFSSEENVEVIKRLLCAMRKEVEVAESESYDSDRLNGFFVSMFRALKRFIFESLAPIVG